MTTYHDVPVDMFMPALANRLEDVDSIVAPEWAAYTKTGVTRERPPTQTNWWHLRTAAVLRKVALHGPIGITALSQAFGGYKDNGSMPNTPAAGSRHVIRTVMQQLEQAGLVELVELKPIESIDGEQMLYKGRSITGPGQKIMDEVAHAVLPQALEAYPGLDKY